MPREAIDFFAEAAKARSLHKLGIWGAYLTPWSYKLGSIVGPGKRHRNLWIVDGFAGAGRYQPTDRGHVQDGSPLIAAEWAQELRVKAGFIKARCINVERNEDCFRELEAATANHPEFVTNLFGEFSDHLNSIIATLGEDPALFLLDPFGVKGLPMEDVVRLLERKGKTELLVHFSDKTFLRMAGHLDANGNRTPLGHKLAESKLETLDWLLGTRLWRRLWENADTPEAAIDKIVDLYLSELRQRIGFAHQIPIRDRLDDRASYRLVFCTNSPHGVELMSDRARRYERELEVEAGADMTLLAESEKRAREAALRDAIQAFGLQRGTATPQEIIHGLAPDHFGKFTTTDYMGRIRELVKEGAIDRPTPTSIKQNEHLTFVVPDQVSLLGPTAT